MEAPPTTSSNEDHPIDARFAWRSLAAAAGTTDTLADMVGDLVSGVTTLLHAITADDSAGSVRATPVTERIDTARELSAAAARLAHAANVAEVLAAGVVEQEGVALNDHERSTRRWLARHNGITFGQASVLCRAAQARERYPDVAAAFDTGEITLGHLDAIANIIPARFNGDKLDAAVEAVGEVQPILIETAANHSVETFTGFCEQVRKQLDPDGTPERTAEPSRVWLSQTVHGRWVLKGDLTADDGALLATILMDTMARNRRADKNTPQPETTPDQRDTSGLDHLIPAPVKPCESERRAAALSELVLDGSSAKAPGRVGVFVHIDLDHLGVGEQPSLAEALTDHTAPHTEAALDITVDTLWSLLADADVTPIFTRTGHTLAYGRTRRLPPPILRRILAHRDRRCRVPGCDQPAIRNEGHHIIYWDDDGPTDPRTCCGTCSFHHHAHHDRGLGIDGDAERELTFTNPDGTPFDATPAHLRRKRARANEAAAPRKAAPRKDAPRKNAPRKDAA